MNLNFGDMPKTDTVKAFEKMFMAGFEPLKNYIQYNKLEDRLTDDDLHMLAHAISGGLSQWCEFLKRANAQASHRHNDY